MLSTYVLIAIAVILGVGAILIFNQLVGRRQMVNNGWADIDVQLRRRSDLIPQLVETVKGYAAHEQTLFEEVTEKRQYTLENGDDPEGRGAAESALSQPIAKLFAVAEAYPDLKASDNFLALQKELSDTENKIEMARRFYNGAVRQLNTAVESFPVNLFAGAIGFGMRSYFEIERATRVSPDINFGDS